MPPGRGRGEAEGGDAQRAVRAEHPDRGRARTERDQAGLVHRPHRLVERGRRAQRRGGPVQQFCPAQRAALDVVGGLRGEPLRVGGGRAQQGALALADLGGERRRGHQHDGDQRLDVAQRQPRGHTEVGREALLARDRRRRGERDADPGRRDPGDAEPEGDPHQHDGDEVGQRQRVAGHDRGRGERGQHDQGGGLGTSARHPPHRVG
nr:hypothetical protein [Pseudonocardia sp.]